MTEGELDKEADKYLWEWAVRQDQYTVDQFGLGVVGIGALFFAYGSISTASLKLLVAFVGFACSWTLWDHMYGARREYDATRKELRSRNKSFFARFDQTQKWRDKGLGRLYQPASRLMMYVMGLVSWAWTTIIVYRIGATIVSGQLTKPIVFPGLELLYQVLLVFSIALVVFAIALILKRKRRDHRRFAEEAKIDSE